MSRLKEQKTNVMRILDQKKIPYEARHYPHGAVFKTLVTRGSKGGYYVFVIPVAEELDLKKAARAVGEKSVAMLHVKELLPLTGYVRGGCSPVGMKKQFPTVFHASALERGAIAVSAGRIGDQVVVEPQALAQLVRGTFADVIAERAL